MIVERVIRAIYKSRGHRTFFNLVVCLGFKFSAIGADISLIVTFLTFRHRRLGDAVGVSLNAPSARFLLSREKSSLRLDNKVIHNLRHFCG